MAELQEINSSGELTEIKLGGTTEGNKVLTSDEVDDSVSTKVPYTGATTDLDLGDNTLDAKRILQSNNVGSIFIGEDAGQASTSTFEYNIYIGNSVGKAGTSAVKNAFVGSEIARLNTSGDYNSGIGYRTLYNLNGGSYNSALGTSSLSGVTTGGSNVGIGRNTGDNITTGSFNTYIGTGVNVSAGDAENEIGIGYNVNSKGSNTATIGNSNITDLYAGENGQATVHAGKFQLSALNTAPTNASDTGTMGEIRYDDTYMYLCVATDTWKRTLLTTW